MQNVGYLGRGQAYALQLLIMAEHFTAPVLGIATAGAGCLLTALGILLSLALLWIALKVVPVLVQGLVNLVRLPFRKAGVIR